jgi:tRNA 5-methylaminomethyl-2-thiouridine biosynthesis bifunctional protein
MNVVNWDNQGQPISTHFDDVYFSKNNGLEESRFVFLQHNQLKERFCQLKNGESFTIGETGFGTGLNFLACWQLWDLSQQQFPLLQSTRQARLTYISVEKFPLSPQELQQALSLWPELGFYSAQLIAEYQRQYTGQHRSCFHCLEFGNVRLLLIFDDVYDAFSQFLSPEFSNTNLYHWQGVDAWFFDGFAPAKNPDMWSEKLFTQLAKLSHAETSFATFTAASSVRKALLKANFEVKKVSGYSTKREMLIGDFKGDNQTTTENDLEKENSTKQTTPWSIIANFVAAKTSDTIAVIGAGLSGCHTAAALAKKGYKVSVFEQHPSSAHEASGNPQSILYVKLSPHQAILGDFNQYSFLFAQHLYKKFWLQNPTKGAACGVLQVSTNSQNQQQQIALAEQFRNSNVLQLLNAEQASQLANVPLKQGGLFFPHCGWINPPALCQWLLNHSNIETRFKTKISELIFSNNRWQLGFENTGKEETFDHVIIANANEAQRFAQTDWLPTKTIRGQISYIESPSSLNNLNIAICGEGYIAPAAFTDNENDKQIQTIGASFNLNDNSLELSEQDHQNNIENICQYFPEISSLKVNNGRAAFRCTSPDYLPLVGPVPDINLFENHYAPLAKNAHKPVHVQGPYLSKLYTNLAHGSRGLAYAPLAAEMLASLIAGDAPPVPQHIMNGLNPARFIVRDIIRSKP